MGHSNLLDRGYEQTRLQRNITCIVGNGFDLQVLRDFKQPLDTQYVSFFHFLKMRSFDSKNIIFKEMEHLQQTGKKDWADVEGVISKITNQYGVSELLDCTRSIQQEFAEYLDMVVSSGFLKDLGGSSTEENWAINSLKIFLGDLEENEYKNLLFPKACAHYDVYSFIFLNFNYTSIFDNYIYLDPKQFDPHKYNTVDRNFRFKPNPKNRKGLASCNDQTSFSSYAITEVFHPHGIQTIAKSLIFGTDLPATNYMGKDSIVRLSKHFWAQNNVRYKSLFDNTELYIIFGCSLGESDRWWWSNILDSLKHKKNYNLSSTVSSYGLPTNFQPEVILYWYNPDGKATRESVVDTLFSVADRNDLKDKFSQYVHVVLFDDSTDRVWLNTKKPDRS